MIENVLVTCTRQLLTYMLLRCGEGARTMCGGRGRLDFLRALRYAALHPPAHLFTACGFRKCVDARTTTTGSTTSYKIVLFIRFGGAVWRTRTHC